MAAGEGMGYLQCNHREPNSANTPISLGVELPDYCPGPLTPCVRPSSKTAMREISHALLSS